MRPPVANVARSDNVAARAFQFAIRFDSLYESIRFVKKIGLSIH